MNLFVGNLNWKCTDQDLFHLFSNFGEVESCKVVMDRDTSRSKGFGFVSMKHDNEAEKAAEEMNGQQFMERALKIEGARERPRRH